MTRALSPRPHAGIEPRAFTTRPPCGGKGARIARAIRLSLDRRLKVMDQVIRHIVVRVDEEKHVVERTRTKRQSESVRRRVKRGLPPQRQPGEGRPAGDTEEAEDDRFDGVEV